MCDYPDPDEEYELMYADELDLLREEESSIEQTQFRKTAIAKRSLDFSDCPVAEEVKSDDISLTPSLQKLDDVLPSSLSSNKRSVDDLFGDINDIDFEEVGVPSKRLKTEEEIDIELIEKIIEGRKQKQMLLEPSRLLTKPDYDVHKCISLNIPRWAFLPVTNSDGDRMYVKFESEDSWEQSLDDTNCSNSLLASYSNTWEEARKLLEDKEKRQTEVIDATDVIIIEPDINGNNLWVDKYKPKSYIDLLSEEPVNRALLHWLHLWDKIVFKKDVKTKEPQQRSLFHKRTGQFQLTNKWKGKKENEPEIDEDGRPHHKVALLCGPPGVGKTTLAHMLARMAGYRPVELNASDERSTEAFRTALHNATLMRSVLDADKRPNCLILDEIDGAPLPTVELLVKWCTATVSDGKKKAKSQPLKRPVIAICNDLYATSLRPLRLISLILTVTHVPSSRLASRLALVASEQGVSTNSTVLGALAARAGGDVRAAVHTLCMLAASGKQLTLRDVEGVSIGTKDCSKSMMQALTAIFQLNDNNPNEIMKVLNAAGEYERLADGVFENYLSARVDARLAIACETTSWLRIFDLVNAWTLRQQNYCLYGMLPICLVRCHRILAQRNPNRVKFPMQAQEMYRKKTELDSVVWSVWRGSSPSVTLTRKALQLDLLPLIPFVLAPKLRSANVQLCSESERKSLRTCASAMCDYGLQYVQQRTEDGLYAFVLEPDVYKYAFFGTEERIKPPPPIRQALAREQQLEVIRRNEEMTNIVTNKGQEETNKMKPKTSVNKENLPEQANKVIKENHLPNHLQRLKPKEIEKVTPQVHKDFFGRIVPISQSQRLDAVPDVIASSSVFYQYREGFNNAVRRNVKTRDLL